MVHYSSCTYCYEGGAKNPLKGTSLKFLVYARYAQFCVFSGSMILGINITAYILSPIFAEASNIHYLTYLEYNLY